MSEAFFLPRPGGFAATVATRGPWDARFQHGGPPAALLAGALASHDADAADWFLARVSFELHRPVPITTLALQVGLETGGRTVQRLRATLEAGGKLLVEARGLRIRRQAGLPAAAPPVAPWPAPETLTDVVFSFFPWDEGYHTAVDLRCVHGTWGHTPIGYWTRPRIPLVAGRESTPLERLVTLADAQSGMGVPMDPTRFTFVNPDLSVFLEREPEGAWLGFDIRSTANSHGSGLAQSAVRDRRGLAGRSAQALVVGLRGPGPG